MAREKKKPAASSSLTALARGLDTRKRELPASSTREVSSSQKAFIENALRAKPQPVARPVAVAAKVAAKVNPPKGATPVAVAAKVVAKANPASPPAPKVAPPPPKVAPPARPAAPVTGSSVARSSALSSLQRAPSPMPTRVPVGAKPAAGTATPPRGDVRRQYPRAEIHVKASLSLADDPSRSFEASLPTVNLSVGGMFLESSFFLKLGTKLQIELKLPQGGRSVKVKGEVVRVESGSKGASGFALRFTEYLEGSQVTLATHFLSPVLREFLSQYAKEHRFDASAEYLAHTADVLAAWELKKAELGGDVWDLFSAKA
ncbi:MAG: PilZ domain-containing protein [Myxococcaceae bacterium]